MYATARILKQKHRRRVEAGYVFKGDGEDKPAYRDLKWNDETLKKFPLIAVLAGVAAGLLGIGGGMVIGPLFIQLDMEPKVGSSSCAFMILWTALSGVVQDWFAVHPLRRGYWLCQRADGAAHRRCRSEEVGPTILRHLPLGLHCIGRMRGYDDLWCV